MEQCQAIRCRWVELRPIKTKHSCRPTVYLLSRVASAVTQHDRADIKQTPVKRAKVFPGIFRQLDRSVVRRKHYRPTVCR